MPALVPDVGNKYESVAVCAARLGVTERFLYGKIRDGMLTSYAFGPTTVRRLKVSEVDELFQPAAAVS